MSKTFLASPSSNSLVLLWELDIDASTWYLPWMFVTYHCLNYPTTRKFSRSHPILPYGALYQISMDVHQSYVQSITHNYYALTLGETVLEEKEHQQQLRYVRHSWSTYSGYPDHPETKAGGVCFESRYAHEPEWRNYATLRNRTECLTHLLLTWFELSQAACWQVFDGLCIDMVCDSCTVPLPGPFDVQVKNVCACELKWAPVDVLIS